MIDPTECLTIPRFIRTRQLELRLVPHDPLDRLPDFDDFGDNDRALGAEIVAEALGDRFEHRRIDPRLDFASRVTEAGGVVPTDMALRLGEQGYGIAHL